MYPQFDTRASRLVHSGRSLCDLNADFHGELIILSTDLNTCFTLTFCLTPLQSLQPRKSETQTLLAELSLTIEQEFHEF